MERVKLLAAAFPLVWITMVACGKGAVPCNRRLRPHWRRQSTPCPSLDHHNRCRMRARSRRECWSRRSSRTGIEDTSCPGTVKLDFIHMPCLHFNFVAPSTGILRVSVTWDGKRTEAVGLIVGEIEADPGWMSGTGYYHYANPKVVRVRVGAGENYRLTAFLVTSHLDYLGWLAGPFQLTTTIE